MKIVVVGAGDVGSYLAQFLAREANELTVVDTNHQRLGDLAEELDIATVHGSGTIESTLRQAGAKGADYLIAATDIDEINVLVCHVAGLLGVKHRIARIRSDEMVVEARRLEMADLVINPDKAAVRAIVDLLAHAGTRDYSEFAGGRIRMITVDVERKGPLHGLNLKQLADRYKELDFRVVCLVREGLPTIPGGDDKLEIGDLVTFAVRSADTIDFFKILGIIDEACRNVMLLGATPMAVNVAAALEQVPGMNVKLFAVPGENRLDNHELAELLPHTTVFDTEGKEIDAMAQEALGDMDALIALSEDEEKNIISCLLAKHLGVKRTITAIQKAEYMPIIKTIGLDVGINKRILAAQEILKFIRRGGLQEQVILPGSGALVATFNVRAGSPLVGKELRKLKLPKPGIFAGFQRRGHMIIPTGLDRFEEGDEATVVTLEEHLPALKKLFD